MDERAKYIKQLSEKLEVIQKEHKKIPFLNLYKQKKNRYQSDIEQLIWRINYLKKVT